MLSGDFLGIISLIGKWARKPLYTTHTVNFQMKLSVSTVLLYSVPCIPDTCQQMWILSTLFLYALFKKPFACTIMLLAFSAKVNKAPVPTSAFRSLDAECYALYTNKRACNRQIDVVV